MISDLAPVIPPFMSRICFDLTLPRTLDRPEAELPVLQTIARLGCPMDFMNSTGVLFPMALCGRSSLYSLR